jgi:hypothetical protein
MYTQSLGVDNSKRRDSFFDLSAAIRVPLLRVITEDQRAVSAEPAADQELNRDYRTRARLFAQFAHFCGGIKPAVPYISRPLIRRSAPLIALGAALG